MSKTDNYTCRQTKWRKKWKAREGPEKRLFLLLLQFQWRACGQGEVCHSRSTLSETCASHNFGNQGNSIHDQWKESRSRCKTHPGWRAYHKPRRSGEPKLFRLVLRHSRAHSKLTMTKLTMTVTSLRRLFKSLGHLSSLLPCSSSGVCFSLLLSCRSLAGEGGKEWTPE